MKLILIGAGGFGREVLAWARQCPECGRDWEVAGFLDDRPDALDGFDTGVPVLGSIADWTPAADEVFVCSIGQPRIKKACVEKLRARGAVFTSILHPSVICGERVRLGEGVILCPRVVLTGDLEIGDHTALNIGCSVGHDVRVGPYGQLQSGAVLNGGVEVGECALFGTYASVLPGKKIGDRATVGAGSVAIRDVPPDTTVFTGGAKEIWKGD